MDLNNDYTVPSIIMKLELTACFKQSIDPL